MGITILYLGLLFLFLLFISIVVFIYNIGKEKNKYKDRTKWMPGYVKCDLCSHKWTAVLPEKTERVKCPKCENTTTFMILEHGKEHGDY